jgi:protein SCO1
MSRAFRVVACSLAMAGASMVPTRSASTPGPPAELRSRVTISQQLGQSVPLDVTFRDSDGVTVNLTTLLGKRPTVLVPGYYGCVNLCGLLRAGVA